MLTLLAKLSYSTNTTTAWLRITAETNTVLPLLFGTKEVNQVIKHYNIDNWYTLIKQSTAILTVGGLNVKLNFPLKIFS